MNQGEPERSLLKQDGNAEDRLQPDHEHERKRAAQRRTAPAVCAT